MGGFELRWNNRFFEERANLLRTQVFPGSFPGSFSSLAGERYFSLSLVVDGQLLILFFYFPN